MLAIDRVKLKKDIRSKFGSLTVFCTVSEFNYNRLLRLLNADKVRDEDIIELKAIYEKSDLSQGVEGHINKVDRKRIRLCILNAATTYTEFCERHSEFDNAFITNIVVGKTKRKNPRYWSLKEILKQQYSYDKFITLILE